MGPEHRGSFDAKGLRVAIVASRYSRVITKELVAAAIDCLTQHGAEAANLELIWVPGSFEIPLAARTAAQTGRFDAIVALGLILRGETNHHELIAGEVVAGLGRLSAETGLPVGLGVITCDTVEQAWERAGIKNDGHGWQAALSVIEMANLVRSLARPARRPAKR